jgi:hypothetical protein
LRLGERDPDRELPDDDDVLESELEELEEPLDEELELELHLCLFFDLDFLSFLRFFLSFLFSTTSFSASKLLKVSRGFNDAVRVLDFIYSMEFRASSWQGAIAKQFSYAF